MQAYSVNELIHKYKQGTASEEEVTFLLSIVQQWTENPDLTIEASEFLLVKSQISQNLDSEIIQVRSFSLWPRIATVAAVFIVVAAGIIFYVNNLKQDEIKFADATDIVPGSVGATLTLTNGKQIRLADAVNGELAKERGVVISKSAEGQVIYRPESDLTKAIDPQETEKNLTNVLSTANGETYRLRLPDGSEVWLNAASTLKYPASFAKRGERIVELTGEAYFEIAKDKSKPFVVESKGQRLEVLGTHFNVNSYSDELNVKTTLLEGAVRVSVVDLKNPSSLLNLSSYILKPNQQAILTNANQIVVKESDANEAIAWKEGYFDFVDENIKSVMRKIGRWYDVNIEFEGNIPTEEFTGRISRFKSLTEVLKMMERSKSVRFLVEGRRVRVMQ